MRRASLFFRFSCCLLVAAFAPGFGTSAAAQAYPSRPVRIIVPVPAGGGVDSLARLVAQHSNASWGQPFIVDNRPGAGGNIGLQTAARALPDGYTLLVSSSGLVTNAAIREAGYDPVRDFKAISKLSANPYILLTTMTLPVSSVHELIAFAKAKPGQLTYASSGAGGILHLSAELLCAQTAPSRLPPAIASGSTRRRKMPYATRRPCAGWKPRALMQSAIRPRNSGLKLHASSRNDAGWSNAQS